MTNVALHRVLNVETNEIGFVGDGVQLTGLHAEVDDCKLNGCVVHHPSRNATANRDHWPYNWRADRGFMERICPHGIGHPDPDTASFNTRLGREHENIHGCCGCPCGKDPA